MWYGKIQIKSLPNVNENENENENENKNENEDENGNGKDNENDVNENENAVKNKKTITSSNTGFECMETIIVAGSNTKDEENEKQEAQSKRMNAIVYISRNCFDYRQTTAELLISLWISK